MAPKAIARAKKLPTVPENELVEVASESSAPAEEEMLEEVLILPMGPDEYTRISFPYNFGNIRTEFMRCYWVMHFHFKQFDLATNTWVDRKLCTRCQMRPRWGTALTLLTRWGPFRNKPAIGSFNLQLSDGTKLTRIEQVQDLMPWQSLPFLSGALGVVNVLEIIVTYPPPPRSSPVENPVLRRCYCCGFRRWVVRDMKVTLDNTDYWFFCSSCVALDPALRDRTIADNVNNNAVLENRVTWSRITWELLPDL